MQAGVGFDKLRTEIGVGFDKLRTEIDFEKVEKF